AYDAALKEAHGRQQGNGGDFPSGSVPAADQGDPAAGGGPIRDEGFDPRPSDLGGDAHPGAGFEPGFPVETGTGSIPDAGFDPQLPIEPSGGPIPDRGSDPWASEPSGDLTPDRAFNYQPVEPGGGSDPRPNESSGSGGAFEGLASEALNKLGD